jgi:hypothetical protein
MLRRISTIFGASGRNFVNFAGHWSTSFGPMVLAQDGSRVRGTYGRERAENPIEGTVTGREFAFRYTEAQESGTGRFWLRRHGSIAGEYLADGAQRALPWQGWRECDGLWETHLGRIRLVQEETGRVFGFAEYEAAARIEGTFEDGKLAFALEAGNYAGRAVLTLDPAGYALNGEWLEQGQPPRPLAGQRILPRPGLTWLVVVEAYWQRALDDNEFAFGSMLRELFARLPRVQVRHRYYHDETSLLHWCRQLLFLPEPAVLMLAGHGEANGLTVNGKIIPPARILESLRYADGLQLLHFSSCLVGQDGDRALIAAPFPVSGYKTSVDWAMSAFTEFIYLDMILEKGLSPAAAAEQLVSLVRFAGNDEIAGSPYRPAGFCFFGNSLAPSS